VKIKLILKIFYKISSKTRQNCTVADIMLLLLFTCLLCSLAFCPCFLSLFPLPRPCYLVSWHPFTVSLPAGPVFLLPFPVVLPPVSNFLPPYLVTLFPAPVSSPLSPLTLLPVPLLPSFYYFLSLFPCLTPPLWPLFYYLPCFLVFCHFALTSFPSSFVSCFSSLVGWSRKWLF
jgi:hypothetical protein